MATKQSSCKKKRGLTIIELVVVVTIIGLIAAIAIPAYTTSRRSSIAAKTANDMRKFADQFNLYNLENGAWPSDGYPATIPGGMEDYLSNGVWSQKTPIGGYWDYDNSAFGFTSGVSVDSATMGDETFAAIDALLDDGNLTTGFIVKTAGDRLSYILAP
ncbi:prepilin-type N-terminal cleavage/methylation domain-containing protein [Pelagicoccus sp. NFK12]|uniref:Prepilin-type N-terminal cleavage/methylation domain-containing protein n=1 Tax=Pelagicoccus enzymogenes TaxID=2773457 RepID=A0A927FAN0_9BACT|nr:prepilin-type N-terminal cleavage/methylation domain-containing protein [Pelagicoccus enzymogenes]MBD5780230.1 prepilin-type N-terminal cleavage/methylation domain-containing protein [Pelagicoccus enzymogenes]MDQ8198507.1 prepilin-type N-terminal cleavage/methylation domain-containing protein [Pelagicoccus enzymogenes]